MIYQVCTNKLGEYLFILKFYFSDTRANELFLVSSPIPIFLILVAYYQFIYNYGPKFMEKRAPFKLDKIMYVYNAFQIFANTYMVVKVR